MPRLRYRTALLAIALGLVGFTASARDDTPKTDKDEKPKVSTPKPPTIKVEKGTIKAEVALKGTLEATDTIEVSVKPEVWAAFTVVKAVDAGTKVKAGDVLIEFDPEKIDRAIKDGETDQRMAELMMKSSELDMPLTERSSPLEMAAAERAYKHAKEDYEKFVNSDLKILKESTELSLKSSANFLENQKEELKQLEKMYRSKDLTEETEEIILKRTRNQVEQAEFSYKMAKIRRDNTMNIELPRREKEAKDGLERAEIAYIRAKNSIPVSLDQKRLGFEKAKYDRARAAEKFANLKKDRTLFTVKSPTDGVVYYGKCVQGNWTGSAMKMQKGGTILGEDVFMTIVKPGQLIVRANADEKDCRQLAAGQACKLTTPAYPDAKLAGTVEKVGTVPVGGGYEVKIKVNPTDVGVIAGMSASVKVMATELKDVLTLPVGLIQTDEADEDKTFVNRIVGGKPEKVIVKLGKRSGGKVEIKEGLAEGDEVTGKQPGSGQ